MQNADDEAVFEIQRGDEIERVIGDDRSGSIRVIKKN